MATEEIYVSIGLESYKRSKASVLKSQADLLRSLKGLHKLMVYSRQKNDLKKKLNQAITSLKSEVNSFEKRFPNVEVPKEFKKEPEITFEPVKEDYSKKDKIDNELKLISEKLRELNEWI